MKAARINGYGGPEVITVVTDAPTPVPSDEQVLIEVHASSLNPFDTTVRSGKATYLNLTLPVTLGGDIAGIITGVGKNITSVNVGDKVYGQASVAGGNSGAFAEFAVTKASQVAHMPASLDYAQAAAIPLTGVSAVQALFEHLELQNGQKLFIHGGSGGIGTMAIQIAKHLGAYVATTVPTEAVDYARTLGADLVIDFKTQDYKELVSGYDAVYELAGGTEFNDALRTLKPGGKAVSMIAAPDENLAKELQVTALAQSTKVTTERLDRLRELVEQGVIAVQIEKTYPLDQIQAAFTARETGVVRGKIAIAIR